MSRCSAWTRLIAVVVYSFCAVTECATSHIVPRDGDLDNDAWSQVTKWMRLNGAEIDQHLVGSATSHGGNTIRGVVSNVGLPVKEVLLKIPYKLWFVSDHFPDIHNASLDKVEGCGDMTEQEHQRLKTAAALAVEARKGNGSFFHTWISTLPTLQDFKAFHPMLSGDHVIKDFGVTPPVQLALSQQARDRDIGWCFDSWKSMKGSPIAHIEWEDDMQLAFANVRTRTYSTAMGHAMIPGADLLNTGPGTSLNSDWDVSKGIFSITLVSPAAERQEVYDVYCVACNNYRMLSIWGVYMEDNKNLVNDGSARFRSLNCSSRTWGGRRTLRAVVEEALDVSDHGLVLAKNFTSPRCKKEALAPQREQGPLRCSLARLTWEYCSAAWGYSTTEPKLAPSKFDLGQLKEAALIDRSARHGVHPELLADLRRSSLLSMQRG